MEAFRLTELGVARLTPGMDTAPRSRTHRLLAAALVGCAALLAVPGTAAAAPVAVHSPAKKHLTISAKPVKDHVKVHEKTQVKGRLDIKPSARSAEDLELLVVQRLQAGVWIDLGGTETPCQPNGNFSVDLSFDVSAELTLRVFHPDSSLYAESYSDVFAFVVL
ncbi:hypothetical protein GCM10010174_38190 [Kutzneria viridogrisea]